MSTLQELIAQRQALDSQIANAREAAIGEAFTQIEAIMEGAQLSREDIVRRFQHKSGANGKGSKVAPKYRNPSTGETWSGRGRQPVWLAAAVSQGRTLADFAIQPLQ